MCCLVLSGLWLPFSLRTEPFYEDGCVRGVFPGSTVPSWRNPLVSSAVLPIPMSRTPAPPAPPVAANPVNAAGEHVDLGGSDQAAFDAAGDTVIIQGLQAPASS